MDVPRILLLTRWSPDGRYSGAELTRKAVACLPVDSVRWAYVAGSGSDNLGDNVRGFLPKPLHWRLRSSILNYLYIYHCEARRVAAEIAEWVKDFNPEIIWLASDMEAIPVASHLRKLTGAYLHLTVYDAFEHCRSQGVLPLLYYPIYMKQVRKVVRMADSIDAVSEELLQHVKMEYDAPNLKASMVFPPSIGKSQIMDVPSGVSFAGTKERNIGFCGSSRVSDRQWGDFLTMLSELDFDFKLHMFGSKEYLNDAKMPSNVQYIYHGYKKEEDVIRFFHESNIHLLCLGVWKDSAHRLFARTSLSSKLTTYSAAAIPVIADVPEESVAWRLLEKHDAGVLCGDDRISAMAGVKELLSDESVWQRKAQGCSALCREHFELEKNMKQFVDLLSKVGG